MTLNGQHSPYQVDLNDPAVVARLIVLGTLHDDQDALDTLARRRPDLDLDALRLVAEVAAAVQIDMQEPYNTNRIMYLVRRPR